MVQSPSAASTWSLLRHRRSVGVLTLVEPGTTVAGEKAANEVLRDMRLRWKKKPGIYSVTGTWTFGSGKSDHKHDHHYGVWR